MNRHPWVVVSTLVITLSCCSVSPATSFPDGPVDGGAGAIAEDGGTPAALPDAGLVDAGSADAGLVDAGSADAGVVLRFIHFNDLHAHLVEHATLVSDGGPAVVVRQGGLARLATLVRQLRAEVPASVLMNVGDTYHGGVEALYTQGQAIAAPVNALGIDVGVPGNWDYAYGPDITRLRYYGSAMAGMQECIQLGISQGGSSGRPHRDGGTTLPTLTAPAFPNLAANVTFKTGPQVSPGDPFLPPTLMKTIGGVKVGFIGISSDIVPRMHPMLACGLTFLGADALASGDAAAWTAAYTALIQQHAQALRAAGAVVVVVMSELGLQKDFGLANVLPGGTVDVFFSAHTHESVFTPLVSSSGALVVESGDDTFVGRMDLRVLNGHVVAHDWLLQPITVAIPEDATMKHLVDVARAPFLTADPNLTIPGNTGAQLALHEAITTVIGHAPHPLNRKNSLDSSFNDFFTEALRTKALTQLGMAPGFRFDSPIATPESLVEGSIVADGTVTLEDAYRFFPVVYGMGTAQVTGSTLRQVLESALEAVYSRSTPLQNGGWLEGFSGFDVGVDLALAAGSRVQSMSLHGGGPMLPSTTYTIAGCRRPMDDAGVLCSHGGFTNVQDLLSPAGTPWTNVEIFRDGLDRAASLHPTAAVIDSSGTPLWPQGPWIQPLQGAMGP
jgi:2',3'-cyclic-nucleotide 2'-phosphodiesterase (5'-nucleotidase family)